jgi:hypothetical protein
MNIYIDCEWNSYRGELISIALVSDNKREFYEVLECHDPEEWVQVNVMPVLNKKPIEMQELQKKLETYLMQFSKVNIVSDWPEDIEKFCSCLITGAGKRINTPPLSMRILRIDSKSVIPHNALWDARGIRESANENLHWFVKLCNWLY